MWSYDDFTMDVVDDARWDFLAAGTGTVCAEPRAVTSTGHGELRVDIERIERAAADQSRDNCKHVLVSTARFEIPSSGVAEFRAKLSASRHNASHRDFRDGFVNVVLVDLASGLVLGIGVTGESVFAIDERLGGPDHPAYTRIVEDPLLGLETGPDRLHTARIAVNSVSGTVTWAVDGELLHERVLPELPGSVRIGLGVFTLHPVSATGSTSLRGQGVSAAWRDITTTAHMLTDGPQ